MSAFEAAFASMGFFRCDNREYEPGWLKVAVFGTPEGLPTHAARQLPNGRWTSMAAIAGALVVLTLNVVLLLQTFGVPIPGLD